MNDKRYVQLVLCDNVAQEIKIQEIICLPLTNRICHSQLFI